MARRKLSSWMRPAGVIFRPRVLLILWWLVDPGRCSWFEDLRVTRNLGPAQMTVVPRWTASFPVIRTTSATLPVSCVAIAALR